MAAASDTNLSDWPASSSTNGTTGISASNATDEGEYSHLERILPSVVAMCILFVLSAFGNVVVFLALVTSRIRKTRISIIILHLTIADLVITFVLMPSEIAWRLLQYWLVGSVACKIFAFLRAFGLYLSSMVLVVVSVDRYVAVVHPLKRSAGAAKRGQLMLLAAWTASALCSMPQVFSWDTHPVPGVPGREQCVTFGSDPRLVGAFSVFFLVTVYFIPLLIMVVAYTRILAVIVAQSGSFGHSNRDDAGGSPSAHNVPWCGGGGNSDKTSAEVSHANSAQNLHQQRLSPAERCSNYSLKPATATVRSGSGDTTTAAASADLDDGLGGSVDTAATAANGVGGGPGGNNNSVNSATALDLRTVQFSRAKARTLRMTVVIVLAFILCWTPYVVMTLWYILDQESFMRMVDERVADVLFIVSLTNSVANPFVYGSYATETRAKMFLWFGCQTSAGHRGGEDRDAPETAPAAATQRGTSRRILSRDTSGRRQQPVSQSSKYRSKRDSPLQHQSHQLPLSAIGESYSSPPPRPSSVRSHLGVRSVVWGPTAAAAAGKHQQQRAARPSAIKFRASNSLDETVVTTRERWSSSSSSSKRSKKSTGGGGIVSSPLLKKVFMAMSNPNVKNQAAQTLAAGPTVLPRRPVLPRAQSAKSMDSSVAAADDVSLAYSDCIFNYHNGGGNGSAVAGDVIAIAREGVL